MVTTIVWLIIGAAFSAALPIGLLLWWRRTRQARLLPFFVGALIWFVFAGTLEQLLHMALKDKNIEELLRMCDLLIDGPFVQAKRDLTLQFRGSANQRLIDMPKTWKAGHIVLWNEA